MTLVAGIGLAIAGRQVMRAFERKQYASTVMPGGGPVPFAKKPMPLPLGPPAASVAPFFTRHEAEGLVLVLRA